MKNPQDFDFVWADKQWMADHFDGLRLQDNQRVNHFRNHYELTRKDLLVKNLKRIKKQLEKEDRCRAGLALIARLRCSYSMAQSCRSGQVRLLPPVLRAAQRVHDVRKRLHLAARTHVDRQADCARTGQGHLPDQRPEGCEGLEESESAGEEEGA